MTLSDLLVGFDSSGRHLKSVLKSKPINPQQQTKLLALLGHEIYHAGQLGVLRRIAGREGAL